jgi:hypothetical protein
VKRYTNYLWYVLRHKWFVTMECFRYGLYWRGLKHDLSKFMPTEFLAYARFFHNPDGTNKQVRDKTGYYKPDDTGDPAFDAAWFHHVRHNDHHWQFWCLPMSETFQIKPFPMPNKAILEMICDWRGAAKAQKSKSSIAEWYVKNREKMKLHPKTQEYIEDYLEVYFPGSMVFEKTVGK